MTQNSRRKVHECDMVQLSGFRHSMARCCQDGNTYANSFGGFYDLERRQVLPGERRKNGFHFILDYPALKDNAQHPASEPWTSGFWTYHRSF